MAKVSHSVLAGEVNPSDHELVSHVALGCSTVCEENGGGIK